MRCRITGSSPAGGPGSVIAVIVELVESLSESPVAVGAGIPRVVYNGDVLTVPNLANWVDQVDLGGELERQLERQLGVPVALRNDLNVGLLVSGSLARPVMSRMCSVSGWAPGSAAL